MTVKYKCYGLTAKQAQEAIVLAHHLLEHEKWRAARNRQTDGIQRANSERAFREHGIAASTLIRKFNSYLSVRDY